MKIITLAASMMEETAAMMLGQITVLYVNVSLSPLNYFTLKIEKSQDIYFILCHVNVQFCNQMSLLYLHILILLIAKGVASNALSTCSCCDQDPYMLTYNCWC